MAAHTLNEREGNRKKRRIKMTLGCVCVCVANAMDEALQRAAGNSIAATRTNRYSLKHKNTFNVGLCYIVRLGCSSHLFQYLLTTKKEEKRERE